MAAAVFAGITDPRGYLGAIGLQQATDNQQTDLLAATQADAIVTRLFSVQAAPRPPRRPLRSRRPPSRPACSRAARAGPPRVCSRLNGRRPPGERGPGDAAADWALTQLGKPYIFSGGPGGQITLNPHVCPAQKADIGNASGATGLVQATLDPEQRCVAAAAILYAAAQLGKPYGWGGPVPVGYDCPG
jgi:cell wall-associated NlpC family hydrolase